MTCDYYNTTTADDLMRDVLDNGVLIKNKRTGEGCYSMFDAKVVIESGVFPFVTNRIVSPRLAFEEMMWFLRGETNSRVLEDKNVNFWKLNTTRQFLDNVGLDYLDEGEMGSAYGVQWRNSGGYDEIGSKLTGKSLHDYSGVDQLKKLVDGLREDKYGRRHLVSLYNPTENQYGVLQPCHWASQYVVLPCKETGKDILHLKMINRSCDLAFGLSFALMNYRFLQMMLCKWFGFELGRLSCDLSHVHIYENQFEYCKEMLTREYVDDSLCSIELTKEVNSLEDLLSIQWEDWNVVYETNRTPFKTQRPAMVS